MTRRLPRWGRALVLVMAVLSTLVSGFFWWLTMMLRSGFHGPTSREDSLLAALGVALAAICLAVLIYRALGWRIPPWLAAGLALAGIALVGYGAVAIMRVPQDWPVYVSFPVMGVCLAIVAADAIALDRGGR